MSAGVSILLARQPGTGKSGRILRWMIPWRVDITRSTVVTRGKVSVIECLIDTWWLKGRARPVCKTLTTGALAPQR